MLQEILPLNEELDTKDFIDIVIEVKEFSNAEYDNDLTVSDIFNDMENDLRLPIAYTQLYGSEYFNIQTYLDLKLLSIVKEVGGIYGNKTLIHYEYEKLANREQAIDYIRYNEFTDMVSINADIDDLIQALKKQ
ncbi:MULTISPECIES: hypothetical protein [Staphylococcus]|uniref:hypothetical protein n=1 Tax=Staphylococcus TaxID=1279 RepID=UPI0008A65E04|nr:MULTISPECIES: hypothetical protein [Staphylococcus]MBO0385368.1 hypothetical protein [Staphylococcus haemolyticus]MCH4334954.1 hypothetical protein [Staphylococcus haemolyticus]OFK33034.1 hypothetical protein HMPREF2821_06630 [Staphylococcus sp. HMSC065C10]